jgi:hypothetical protein
VLLAGVVFLSTTAALVVNLPSIAAITPAMETGVYQLMEHVGVGGFSCVNSSIGDCCGGSG